jgi:hypothetical protein
MIEIGSHNTHDFLNEVTRCNYSRGLVERDYRAHPQGYLKAVKAFPDSLIIPTSEQQSRLERQQAGRESMYDLRMANYDTMRSLDQDGLGLCWAFSTTKATMYARLLLGLPSIVLSAWWVAGIIKGWRDQGGWGSESAGFIANRGAPAMELCPSYRSSYDTSATQQNAALHKLTFVEGNDDPEYNTKLMITACLLNLPWVGDLNWLSHSMCGCRLVSTNPLVVDYDNSWNAIDQYGEKGLYRITGQRAMPNNIVVVLTSTPSIV